jgi:hypothetical protein
MFANRTKVQSVIALFLLGLMTTVVGCGGAPSTGACVEEAPTQAIFCQDDFDENACNPVSIGGGFHGGDSCRALGYTSTCSWDAPGANCYQR